jgi:peptide chain release factor 1
MLDRLAEIEKRFEEVNHLLTQPEVVSDMKQMAALSKEFKELNKIIVVLKEYRQVLEGIQGAKELLATESDEAFRELAKAELAELEPREEELEAKLKDLLTPRDPEDLMDVILEIRAGTGGDEASLFAGDLFAMYKRFCENRGWRMEVTDYTEGTVGGYKEIIASIQGEDAYGTLKFESGVHRVQRVPKTETQGRVHTSAATVVVMPQPEDFAVDVNEKDVRIDRFCSSGNGGQSVNTTYSAVRLTHIPTGIVVSMQNERSQLKNLDAAWKILRARIYEAEMAKRKAAEEAIRKSLVSTGDRSAKIRTYNFPQSRVTDHRIGLTVYNLDAVMNGELDEFVESLRIAENAEKLAAGSVAIPA